MSAEQLNNIERTLGTILGELKGVNCRLDITNGRVGKLEDRTNHTETELDQMKGRATILGAVAGIVVSIGLSVLNKFVGK
jgi:hypothetical protein